MKNLRARITRRLKYEFLKIIYSPNLDVSKHSYSLVKLGTPYGGWTFVETDKLRNSTIISCGLGEDASFDIEFASRFNSKVVLVDPTPRAVKHYHEIMEHIGKSASEPYATGGKQPVESYDLSSIDKDSLILVDKALWNECSKIKFFSPEDPSDVSHSIVDFQHNWSRNNQFIEVDGITIDRLLDLVQISSVPLMKLDIEGAEIEVLHDMMKKKVYPDQILVEFDELSVPSKVSKSRIESIHSALVANNYQLINFDPPTNFLYIKSMNN